jgi:hypothetical protein
MEKVAKKQQHDGGKMKASKLQELMGEVLDQIEGVTINLSEAEETVEP